MFLKKNVRKIRKSVLNISSMEGRKGGESQSTLPPPPILEYIPYILLMIMLENTVCLYSDLIFLSCTFMNFDSRVHKLRYHLTILS